MGLDTSHDCWHGAYSAFTRWRNQVAKTAGYEVLPVKYDGGTFDTPMIDWGHLPEGYLQGVWPETPNDPLLVLIAHSDCDGQIMARDCGPLADRLQSLLPQLPDGEGGGHIGNWRETTQRFIDGLRCAASRGENVEFY